MAKLSYIGREDYLVNYKCNSDIPELVEWFNRQKAVQFDTETNKTDSIVNRKLKVVQFGNLAGDEIFVIQWSYLSDEEKDQVRALLWRHDVLKIIQNASFDYQVFLNEKVVLENVWDTMVMEQCIFAGYDYDLSFFSLATILERRYHLDISKAMQCEFGDDIIDDEKLLYAATDVVHLGRLYQDQFKEMQEEDILQLGNGEYNENEVVLAFADMEYYGVGFDPEPWRANIAKAQPILDKATADMNSILLQDEFLQKGYELEVNSKLKPLTGMAKREFKCSAILQEDTFAINWGSGPQVKGVLAYLFPDMEKSSALEVKKYLLENDPNAPKTNSKGGEMKPSSKEFLNSYINVNSADKFMFLKLFLRKDFKALEAAMIDNFKDQLIEDQILLPKNSVMINWNSANIRLEVFRWFNPEIEDTTAQTVLDNMHVHDFFKAYEQYAFAHSLISKYGENFIAQNVDIDGRVRTRFNTILATGRVSSSKPNMQQIPAKRLPKDRQNDYRNCFIPGIEGWSIVGSDYASQELAIIGTLSEDPVFLDALRTGKDLHSTCAALVYGDKWKEAAEDDCEFYKPNDKGEPSMAKCSCPKHEKLRDGVKAINFG